VFKRPELEQDIFFEVIKKCDINIHKQINRIM